MRSAVTEPAEAVTVAHKTPPNESWVGRLWARLFARRASDTAEPPEGSLLAFAPEKPERPVQNRAAQHTRDGGHPVRPRRRLTRAQAATAAVVLVVIVQGAWIALWLNSRNVAVRGSTGSLTITSEPVGASVSVDGTRLGLTPSTISLPSGEHRIEIGEGAALRTRTVNMTSGGDVFVHVELPSGPPQVSASAGTGDLEIRTDPSGAQVSVDGQSHGAAPILATNLSAGPHTVTVSSPSGRVTQQVTVPKGSLSSLVISMTGTAQFASGWLAISSPIPAQILEGGRILGSTDTPRVLVSAGRHDLELTNSALGYRVRRTVQITAGQTTSLKLEVPNGMLHINALPWAEVWIGTRALGETPIANLSLPLGSHELLFRHPELGELRRTVVVGAGAAVRVGVDLRKGPQ